MILRSLHDPNHGAGGVYPDESERQRALRYSRTQEWLGVIHLGWNILTLTLALVTGLSAWLRTRAQRVAPARLGPAIPYSVVGSAIVSFVSLPLSFYGGYTIEHRYGLSNQTKRAWILEWLKGLGLSLIFGSLLIHAMYWFIRRYPLRWWAVLSGLMVPFSIVLTNLAPVLLMPLFNKFEPVRDRDLEKRIKDLAAGEGVNVSNVMQMDMSKQTKKANAFFTGVGNTKRIVLGDTMLDEFTTDEIEVVLAHELGHQVHRDLWKLIALQVPVTLSTFYAMHSLAPVIQRRFGSRWGLNPDTGVQDVAALPLLGLVGTASSTLLLPVLNAIVRNWVEHPADRYALELTGKSAPFISAMEKLGRMNLSNPSPSLLVKWLFHNHPTLQERIDFGRQYEASHGPTG